jgi:hypothetical protein
MKPIYEASTGFVIIEWYEAKKDKDGKKTSSSPVHHYFSGKPTMLQLHPKDEKQVVRVTFAGEKHGKMPLWMEKYAKEHDFQCQQVTHKGEVGWWLANWRIYPTGFKPIASPHVAGAVTQLSFLIPEVCEELRTKLVENKEIAQQNLINYPTIYQPFGLFFRKEEIHGQGGSLLVDEELILRREDGETDEDYRIRIERDGRLEKLIYELVTPLPEPIPQELPKVREEEIVEEEFSLDEFGFLEEDVEEESQGEASPIEEEELPLDLEFEDVPEIEFEDIPEEDLDEFIFEDDEGSVVVAERILSVNEEDSTEVVEIEDVTPPTEVEADVPLQPVMMEEEEPVQVEDVVPEVISEPLPIKPVIIPDPPLIVVETKDKKSGACEGQLALF